MRYKGDAKAPHHSAVYIYIACLVVCNYKRCTYWCLTASELETFISYLQHHAFSEHVQPKRAFKQAAMRNNGAISRFHIVIFAEGALRKFSSIFMHNTWAYYMHRGLLKKLVFSQVLKIFPAFNAPRFQYRAHKIPLLATQCRIYRLHVPPFLSFNFLSVTHSSCLIKYSRVKH